MKAKLLLSMILVLSGSSAQADRVSDNVRIMIDLARKLELSTKEGQAFRLVKQETMVAPVAVIFGYGDNKIGCEELALALSNSGRVGTFKCEPVY